MRVTLPFPCMGLSKHLAFQLGQFAMPFHGMILAFNFLSIAVKIYLVLCSVVVVLLTSLLTITALAPGGGNGLELEGVLAFLFPGSTW